MLMLIFVTMTALGSAQAQVNDPVYDELEGISLAEALIRDGKTEAAGIELKKLKPSDRYWQAHGDIAMAGEKWAAALNHYAKVSDPRRRGLLSARGHYAMNDFNGCSVAYSESGDLWLAVQNDIVTKAACEQKSGRSEAAWKTLSTGRRSKDSYALQREQVALQLELNLAGEALKNAIGNGKDRSTSEWLGLAELFHNKNRPMEALSLVELARAKAPFDLDANLSAAQVYFQRGDLRSTAEAFERASQVDRKFAYHAAELHRQIGHPEQSAYFAQLIPQEKERLKARMALYVETGRYALISSMDSVIGRSELKDDDEMRYALAYSQLRQGNFDRPLMHLSRIRKPELLEKAALLKKAVLDCKAGTCRM